MCPCALFEKIKVSPRADTVSDSQDTQPDKECAL